MDVVGWGKLSDDSLFLITTDKNVSFDEQLLRYCGKGYLKATEIVEVELSTQFPLTCLSEEMSLHIKSRNLTTGLYYTILNEHWFGLVNVVNVENIRLRVAPRVFSELCERISKKNLKVQRSLTPPPPASRGSIGLRPTNSFTDNTISLSGWSASQPLSQPTTPKSSMDLKEQNKAVLKASLLFLILF